MYINSVVVVQFLGKYIILVMGGSTYEVVVVVTTHEGVNIYLFGSERLQLLGETLEYELN